jgi:NADPH:quinone reductase-like Zn-dependent oxidoreductase
VQGVQFTVRKLIITKAGGPEVFAIEEHEDLTPPAGQVVVDVKAIGINFADILARQGLYPDAPRLPCCVGYEFSGVVSKIGEGIEPDLLERAVFGMSRFNGYATQVCVPLQQIFDKPDNISFEEAAGIPVNYLTAWQLLVVMGSLQPTDSILIHNAGGGVGLAALDIAKHIGATTYGTSSPEKHTFLKHRGLDNCIDYRNQDWEQELAQLTNNAGVELIIDPLGGGHWRKSYRALRATGRLGMFGISTAADSHLAGKLKLLKTAAQMPFFHPVSLMNENKSVFGVNMGKLWHEPAKIRQWMDRILTGIKEDWIRPHVDKSFRFEGVAKAHAYIEARKNKGKVVLTV